MEKYVDIKSPITGGRVREFVGKEIQIFRKEEYLVHSRYYICEDTGERFTTTEQDSILFGDLYSQYRLKHGIPFPDEIRNVRLRYGLNYSQISRILGLGQNQYAQYEKGQMPSDSNGRILRGILDRNFMLNLLESSRCEFSEAEFKKIKEGILNSPTIEQDPRNFLFYRGTQRSIDNGLVTPSPDKLVEMVKFLISKEGGIFPTKLNKELFYSDFLHFKLTGHGISGLAYKAIQYGPVPLHYNTIYDNIEGIERELVIAHGMESTKMRVSDYERGVLSPEETATLERVSKQCVSMTTEQLLNASHEEAGWIAHQADRGLIPYSDAYELRLF